MKKIKNIIFDLGGVLIDWNPEYVYLKVFDGNREKMKWFFDNICTFDWNENQDAGYSLKKATLEKVAEFPQHKNLIEMYYGRWEEMLGGPIQENVALLNALFDTKQFRIVALTNWSAETFPVALDRFDFLHRFEGIVVSGEEKIRKPFLDIYHTTLERFNLNPKESLFIDDNFRNIKAAIEVGIHGIHYQNHKQLKKELAHFGIKV